MGLGPYTVSALGDGSDASTWPKAEVKLKDLFDSGVTDAGSTALIADDHSESTAAEIEWYGNQESNNKPVYVICVRRSGGSFPPVTADLRTTAVIATTGSGGHNKWRGNFVVNGINLESADQIRYANGYNGIQRWFNSSGYLKGSGGYISLGETGEASLEWFVHTLRFSNAAQVIKDLHRLLWEGGGFHASTTVPTYLFDTASNNADGVAILRGVDLSALTGVILSDNVSQSRDLWFENCKMPSSYTLAASQSYPYKLRIGVFRSANTGTLYPSKYQLGSVGSLTEDTALYLSGTNGASDGTTSFGWKIVTTSVTNWGVPFVSLPLKKNNAVTGADVTITIDGIWTSASLPNDEDFYIEVGYPGSAASPLASFKSSNRAFLASAAALTATTNAWAGPAARANSTTYAVGNQRTVASNPGRIFEVTAQVSASAGSEPAAFATAVDGDAITDGGVTWRCMRRFKMTVTLTGPPPQFAGPLNVRICAGKTSATAWFNPNPVLS